MLPCLVYRLGNGNLVAPPVCNFRMSAYMRLIEAISIEMLGVLVVGSILRILNSYVALIMMRFGVPVIALTGGAAGDTILAAGGGVPVLLGAGTGCARIAAGALLADAPYATTLAAPTAPPVGAEIV